MTRITFPRLARFVKLPAPRLPRSLPERWPQFLPPVLVFVVAANLAVLYLTGFFGVHRQLWSDPLHDRHAHLYSGLSLALDLREGHVGQFLSDLDKFRTWPPLHDGLMVGSAVLIGGGDERWAVLPSLLGWIGAAVFAFLLARRAVHPGGSAAGVIAATFVLVSPAQRAFATDVMLESLGACLTLAALYYYVAAVQDKTPAAWRWLALALTAVFFEKYNYWLLVALALTATQFLASPHRWVKTVRGWATTAPWRPWFAQQLRHPLTYVLAVLLAVIAVIRFTGGTTFTLAGRDVSLTSTSNLVTVAYAVLMLRVLPWFWRDGRPMVERAGPEMHALVYWHVAPIAAWFLWPQRLGSFLWFLYPGTNPGEFPDHSTWGGYVKYWDALAADYHVGAWSAGLALALLALAALAAATGRLRPGATAIVLLVVIASLLTAHHPNRKSRFLHSWVPLVWVGAGVGAASLFGRRRARASWPARPTFGAIAVGGLVIAHLPGLTQAAHAPEGGVRRSAASFLDVTDAYLPHLADCQRVAVFANVPMKFATWWTFQQRYPRADRPETDIKGFNPVGGDNRACFERWLATTRCDAVAFVDIRPGSAFALPLDNCDGLAQYGTLMRGQSVFRLAHEQDVAPHGCTVTVWRRGGTSD